MVKKINTNLLSRFLQEYFSERPFFIGLIRAKEAVLFQKHLPFKKPVLDYGCGDGFFASVTFGKQKIDVGLDIDKKVLEEATKYGIYNELKSFRGKKFPFRDKRFNTIVSNCVLEHVKYLDTNLKECSRILKKDGLFITSVMTNKWEDYLFGSMFLGGLYKKWMRKKQVHLNLLNESEWDKEFNKAGFSIVEKIGYLNNTESMFLDIAHYLSVPSLAIRKITGKWVLTKNKNKLASISSFISKYLSKTTIPRKSAAIFYVLKNT